MKIKKIMNPRFLIFLTVFLIFLTFASIGRLGTNPSSRFMLTKSIVKYHQLNISNEDVDFYSGQDYAIKDGNYYLDKPPGLSFLSIPLYVLGDQLYKVGVNLPQTDTFNYPGDANAFFLILIFMMFVGSIAVLKLFDLFQLLNFSKISSLVLSYIFAFGTIFWVYVATLFAHSFSASLMIIVLYLLLKNKKLFSGILLGLAITIEYTIILFIPAFLIYFFLRKKNFLNNCFHFFFPVLIFLSLLAVYNWIVFGGPFEISYLYSTFKDTQKFDHPLLDGLYHLTISSWRGLFFFNPVLLLSIPGAILFFKKYRNETVLLLLMIFPYLILFSTYSYFTGGVSYGPRHLITIIPALILLSSPFFEKSFYKNFLKKIPEKIYFVFISVLLFISIFHTFLGVFVNSFPYPEIDKNPIYNIVLPQLFSGTRNSFLYIQYPLIFTVLLTIDVFLLLTSIRYYLH